MAIQYYVKEAKRQEILTGGCIAAVDGNAEQSYNPYWRTGGLSVSLGISLHNWNAEACGRACKKAKGGNGHKCVEQDVLRTLIVTKRVIFKGMEFVGKYNQPRDIILTYRRVDNLD